MKHGMKKQTRHIKRKGANRYNPNSPDWNAVHGISTSRINPVPRKTKDFWV